MKPINHEVISTENMTYTPPKVHVISWIPGNLDSRVEAFKKYNHLMQERWRGSSPSILGNYRVYNPLISIPLDDVYYDYSSSGIACSFHHSTENNDFADEIWFAVLRKDRSIRCEGMPGELRELLVPPGWKLLYKSHSLENYHAHWVAVPTEKYEEVIAKEKKNELERYQAHLKEYPPQPEWWDEECNGLWDPTSTVCRKYL
jgi:hypothetical protein